MKKLFWLAALALCLAGCGAKEDGDITVMEVKAPGPDGAEVTEPGRVGQILGGAYDATLGRLFPEGRFQAAMVGRYLDLEPAQRTAALLRQQGLTAFTLKRRLEEKRLVSSNIDLGEFYFTLAGLFKDKTEAEVLGRRLAALGLVRHWRAVPVDDPGEIGATEAQNKKQDQKSARLSQKVKAQAARPLGPKSSAASGEAFRQNVYGRYVGSYRDPWQAQAEAESLSRSGWQASVESAGGWHRVFLAPTEDHRDWKSNEAVLSSARRSAASQPGFVILADMSSMAGRRGSPAPDAERGDASACAGFSKLGRVGAAITRTILYIPDTSWLAGLMSITARPEASRVSSAKTKLKNWWDGEAPAPPAEKADDYPLTIFHRPEMEAAIDRLQPDPGKASLAAGLRETARLLGGVPGRKILVVFSDFRGGDTAFDLSDALRELRSQYGTSLNVVFVYGDADADGLALAQGVAREAGGPSGRAWDCCLLLNNNAYFERYVKSVFR